MPCRWPKASVSMLIEGHRFQPSKETSENRDP
jgi:hypothetical protein